MSDLVDFLLARFHDDEDQARAAAGWDRSGIKRGSGRWRRFGLGSVEDDEGRSVVFSDANQVPAVVADHLVRFSPARVLAECDAKWRIATNIGVVVRDPFGVQWPDGYREALEHTLRLLALPYVDHPDFREEWRP